MYLCITDSLCDRLGPTQIWNKCYDYSEQLDLFLFFLYVFNKLVFSK